MRKERTKAVIALLLFSGMLAVFGLSNPDLLDYQKAVLTGVALERQSASDAMLTSILQSIAIPSSSMDKSEHAPSVLTVLTDRTRRSNYVMFSVYTTEFDYCESQNAVRTVGRSLGIVGKFYTLDKGECRSERHGYSEWERRFPLSVFADGLVNGPADKLF
ncbi:MAG: DUF4359 domain-containing protein [Nitrospirota bacterium]|nr:DUF4359 domain-containing protein [Nitrospirota bacterium]